MEAVTIQPDRCRCPVTNHIRRPPLAHYRFDRGSNPDGSDDSIVTLEKSVCAGLIRALWLPWTTALGTREELNLRPHAYQDTFGRQPDDGFVDSQ